MVYQCMPLEVDIFTKNEYKRQQVYYCGLAECLAPSGVGGRLCSPITGADSSWWLRPTFAVVIYDGTTRSLADSSYTFVHWLVHTGLLLLLLHSGHVTVVMVTAFSSIFT